MSNTTEELHRRIEELKEEVILDFMGMLRIPVLAPELGGKGEWERATYLLGILEKYGFTDEEIEVIEANDSRVPEGTRPNILVRIKGGQERAVWIITHMDVVPSGNPELWDSSPFEPVIRDGKIFARGSEDNGQEMFASLLAARALKESGLQPEWSIVLAMVADEEVGSTHGMKYLLDNGYMPADDFYIVPDHGVEDGLKIEIAEKSSLWLKYTVKGKQTHASTPNSGLNAHFIGANLIVSLIPYLRQKYDARDDLFSPPISTFEVTRKEENVPNINTIPGEDIFYTDFRVMPGYDLNEIVEDVRGFCKGFCRGMGADVEVSVETMHQAPPPTNMDAPVVKLLSKAIESVTGKRPDPEGIGGGTCAAVLRDANLNAVVWSTEDHMAHDSNEYAWIKNIVQDAKIYASLFYTQTD